MRSGVALVNYYVANSEWPAMEPDCAAQSVDHALLAVGRKSGSDSSAEGCDDTERDQTTLFPCVPKWKPLGASAQEDTHLSKDLTAKLEKADVLFIGGECGCGKSTRVPETLARTHENRDITGEVAAGVAHCIPTNSTAHTLYQYYRKKGGHSARMVCRWHGALRYTHEPPRTEEFVALCTPVSLFHRLQKAAAWDDIRYLVLDEV